MASSWAACSLAALTPTSSSMRASLRQCSPAHQLCWSGCGTATACGGLPVRPHLMLVAHPQLVRPPHRLRLLRRCVRTAPTSCAGWRRAATRVGWHGTGRPTPRAKAHRRQART